MSEKQLDPSQEKKLKEGVAPEESELSPEDLEKVSGGSLMDIIDFESTGGGDW